MSTKIKITLMTIFLFFGLLPGLQAQEKYEYAAVSYLFADGNIVISIAGKDVKTVAVTKEETMPDKRNLNPVLKQLQELSDSGWEWFNSCSTFVGGPNNGGNSGVIEYHYYLRRKKQ